MFSPESSLPDSDGQTSGDYECEPLSFHPGDQLNLGDDYTIIRQIHGGEKALSDIFLAESSLGRVALKFHRVPDGKAYVRAYREMLTQASLEDEGALPMLASGTLQSERVHPYMVSPYMPGGTLGGRKIHASSSSIEMTEKLAKGLIPPVHALGVMHDSEGVVHRDFKPVNILVDADGNGQLIDFWTVAMSGEPTAMQKVEDTFATGDLFSQRFTVAGGFMGTPAYVDRNLAWSGEVSPAQDIYAVGATIFELTTGRLLHPPAATCEYSEDSFMTMPDGNPPSEAAVPNPRDLNPRVPKEVADLALRCLSDISRRPSAAEVESDLRAIAA